MKSLVLCVLLSAVLVHPSQARSENGENGNDGGAKRRRSAPAESQRQDIKPDQQRLQKGERAEQLKRDPRQAEPQLRKPLREPQQQERQVQQSTQQPQLRKQQVERLDKLQPQTKRQAVERAGKQPPPPEQHPHQPVLHEPKRLERHAEEKVLSAPEARSALERANAARAGQRGVNSRPIPQGEVTRSDNGRMTVRTPGGRNVTLRPNGSLAVIQRGDTRAAFRPDGRVRELHRPSIDVMRGPRAERTIRVRRPDRSVVVSVGPRSGYVQRPVIYRGHEYVRRSYMIGGARYQRFYTTYRYRNVVVESYVPRYYYAPRYYGWAYYPWRRPVVYHWGWAADPWYGQGYFVASPVYAGPSYWLVDFFLAETLMAAYQSQAVANEDAAAWEADPDEMVEAEQATPITPELKREIAEQVKDQIARENQAAQDPQHPASLTGLEAALVPGHIFVADTGLTVETANGLSCHLSPGNALELRDVPPDGAAADLSVASSREGDCPGGAQVTISLEYLADMHNAFRAQLDGGMQALRKEQGTSGLPRAPAGAIEPPPRPTVDLPEEDDDVAQSLSEAQNEADGSERDIEDAASDLE
jgi:hypothetical protein